MKYVLVIGLVLLFISAAVGMRVYRYHDCKKVGHSTFYCITDNQ